MGWETIPWYTLTDDFDANLGVDEWHGTNAFSREGDRIFRTYFVDNRGDEAMGSTWSYLDIKVLGVCTACRYPTAALPGAREQRWVERIPDERLDELLAASARCESFSEEEVLI